MTLGPLDILLLSAIFLAFVAAILYLYRHRKQQRDCSNCNGNCEQCKQHEADRK